jgi:hypothetical protein
MYCSKTHLVKVGSGKYCSSWRQDKADSNTKWWRLYRMRICLTKKDAYMPDQDAYMPDQEGCVYA